MNNIWINICNVIYESQYRNIFKSLKIPIYGFATKKFNTRITYIFKYFILIFCRLSKYEIKNNVYDMVFFLPYRTTSNTENLLPVVNSSLASGNNTLLILGEDFKNINYNFCLPGCKYLQINKLYANVSMNMKLLYILTAIKYFYEIYRSFKNYPIIRKSIRHNLLSLYFHIYSTLISRDVFNNVFSNISSKCAISTGDFWPIENQFIQSSIEHGNDTYLIQHGTISNYWWPFDAKYYLVWGQLHKEQLVSFGAPEKKIFIVGMPALDNKASISTEYSINPSKPINVLIMSQTHAPYLTRNIFLKYASCLRLFNEIEANYVVTVKLHPNEDMRFYDKYGLSNSKKFIFIKKERPIHELILESDLCITLFSTGGLEAIALNRALIVLNLESWIEEMAWWPKHGGGLYIPDEISFKKLLFEIVNDMNCIYEFLKNQKDFVKKSFSNYGNASNVIINKISSDMIIDQLGEH